MYDEQFRPQLHFSPKEKWLNDPNGLVYYKEEYHLFYQYHPHDTVWGPMHWGHAVSKDLLHWEELPIALYPDELGQIFSGSAVIDKQNTSGLKSSDEDVMVAIFTHHGKDNEKQSIAYSNDRGRSWTKYAGNPVIDNPGIKDFRDPKVFWHEESQKWVMSLACGDCIHFYGSPNLIDWNLLSTFGSEYGAHGGVWECPDLIPLAVKGENERKWVLIVSINPGGPNGGSVVQYFIGDFDGTTFCCDDEKEVVKWADFGRDFYAAVTWSNLSEPTWIGWMSNWQYANQVPTNPFRSVMSIPRKLSLRRQKGDLTLVQTPFDLSSLYKNPILSKETITLQSSQSGPIVLDNLQFIAEANVVKNTASSFSITLYGEQEKLQIIFDRVKHEVRIDRRNSGQVSFSEHFASVDTMPLAEVNDFTFILDKTSIELFVNQGSRVMTELFYPCESDYKLEFMATEGEVVLSNVTIHSLESTWK
ncbi:glycoside hydrolase family 32 protein [Bacillus sp. ISL-46]|uniref:glycoside hydrolase family 32 protein n=1 Tax=Bacillus sp. ISL-46 TaxID=2819129 RepID=UPI001BE6E351|nr:glycoside hydrolase family 32 protein [Bacillus sp. ISL-46]MBT2719515.1 glycoside hydrolase family 32 protein [Bacillus sp. ISL-46]